MRYYIIFGGVDEYDNQPLFWNNGLGWVDMSSGTRYTLEEKGLISHLPNYSSSYTPVWVEVTDGKKH